MMLPSKQWRADSQAVCVRHGTWWPCAALFHGCCLCTRWREWSQDDSRSESFRSSYAPLLRWVKRRARDDRSETWLPTETWLLKLAPKSERGSMPWVRVEGGAPEAVERGE